MNKRRAEQLAKGWSDEMLAQIERHGDELLRNDDRSDILDCGRRYDQWRYSLAVATGCGAALALLTAAVWLAQWLGWWPGR